MDEQRRFDLTEIAEIVARRRAEGHDVRLLVSSTASVPVLATSDRGQRDEELERAMMRAIGLGK